MRSAFTHCALHVGDVEASIAFYREYCGLALVHEHGEDPTERTVWLAEPGRERDFVLVLVPGGKPRKREPDDMTHLGFAVPSREAIDEIAELGQERGCLHWEPRELPPPVGYLCALEDPDGYVVEFSYGQPLGPGTRAL